MATKIVVLFLLARLQRCTVFAIGQVIHKALTVRKGRLLQFQ
jgi:hypothetical protein